MIFSSGIAVGSRKPSLSRAGESFIGFRTRYVPVDMIMKTGTGRALFALIIISSLCIPVSAYSADALNLYDSGCTLMLSGNNTGAVALYNKAIALEPEYFEAWNGIADALNRDGQFDDAIAASNRSLEIQPDYVNGWINRGQILYNIGYRYEDVAHDMAMADTLYVEQLSAFEKAISLDPDNAEAWFNKGYALAGMKRYDEAIAAFDHVNVIAPSYPNLQKNREIALQLRDKVTATIVTTAPINQTLSETSGHLPTTTSAQPSPFPVELGFIAIVSAAFLIMQRK